MLPLSPSDPLAVRLTEGVRDLLEAWTGQSLVFTSFYGIRIYNEGSVLAPHVDRSPFVTSAVLNVEQDIDQPWPLEVIGHDGIAHNSECSDQCERRRLLSSTDSIVTHLVVFQLR